jgi:hypothetical protein
LLGAAEEFSLVEEDVVLATLVMAVDFAELQVIWEAMVVLVGFLDVEHVVDGFLEAEEHVVMPDML